MAGAGHFCLCTSSTDQKLDYPMKFDHHNSHTQKKKWNLKTEKGIIMKERNKQRQPMWFGLGWAVGLRCFYLMRASALLSHLHSLSSVLYYYNVMLYMCILYYTILYVYPPVAPSFPLSISPTHCLPSPAVHCKIRPPNYYYY